MARFCLLGPKAYLLLMRSQAEETSVKARMKCTVR